MIEMSNGTSECKQIFDIWNNNEKHFYSRAYGNFSELTSWFWGHIISKATFETYAYIPILILQLWINYSGNNELLY